MDICTKDGIICGGPTRAFGVFDREEIVCGLVGCCDTYHDFKSRTREGKILSSARSSWIDASFKVLARLQS